MAIALGPAQQAQLLDFLGLLAKWNRVFNLTAVSDPEAMVSRQLLDSLSILGLFEGPAILDIGSGAGLPGLPLAIARPDLQFTLLDSNSKKTRFMRQFQLQAGLGNVQVVHSRVETFQPPARFQTVTSRAFSSLLSFHALGSRLVAEQGRLLAMKGSVPVAEMEQLGRLGCRVRLVALQVPGCSGERHAVIVGS